MEPPNLSYSAITWAPGRKTVAAISRLSRMTTAVAREPNHADLGNPHEAPGQSMTEEFPEHRGSEPAQAGMETFTPPAGRTRYSPAKSMASNRNPQVQQSP